MADVVLCMLCLTPRLRNGQDLHPPSLPPSLRSCVQLITDRAGVERDRQVDQHRHRRAHQQHHYHRQPNEEGEEGGIGL